MHRTRYFEVLSEKGNDPHQTTANRSFSLVDAMASKIDACRASQAIYRAPLWEWLAGVEPSLLRLNRWVEQELAARGYVRLNRHQAEIWQFVLPKSHELDWSEHELKWQLHSWGNTFEDLTLSAALVLEARLAGAHSIVDRWLFPLEQHLALLTRQPWLAVHARQPAIRQFRDFVLELATTPPRRIIRRACRGDSVIHRPILDIQGDVAWFFAHLGTLTNIDMLWLEVGEAEADRTLSEIREKRSLFSSGNPPILRKPTRR